MGNVDRPHNQAVTSNNRAVSLRLLLCALALVLCATVARGQWLEAKITLPDSLGGATGSACLTTDSSERFVYVGDIGGAVYVVDAEAGLRVGKVLTNSPVNAVCSNPRRNKVYAGSTGNKVTVISCATNQAVATVSAGIGRKALCYNSHDDKVYCVNWDSDDDLTIIDGASDSVIKTMHVGGGQSALCYNPASNRVFCVVSGTVTVLDGASDTIVALVEASGSGSSMSVNPLTNKLYVTGGGGVVALDGTTGVALDSIATDPVVGMSCNPATNRLYIGCDDDDGTVLAIDGAADTLVDYVEVGHFISSVACDTAANRVYVARHDLSRWKSEVVVIDGITNSIATRITAGCDYGELLGSSRRGRMYCTDRGNISVIDVGPDSVLHTVKLGGACGLMCYDSTDDKVYYVIGGAFGEAGAIDAATNRPVAHIPVGRFPVGVVWHPPNGRIFCANNASSDLTVIDPRADTVVKTVTVGRHPSSLCSAPGVNKVYCYCAGGDVLAVIDCGNDSVVKTIQLPTSIVTSMCYVSTASYDKLYCGGFGAVSIIDCVGDTLIRSYSFAHTILARDSDGKRVYCWRPYSLCTFDTGGDTLVADVPWVATGGSALLYVPGVEKVYCACGANMENYVLVANAMTDTVIIQIPTPGPSALGYDSITGLVYCGRRESGKVMLINSRTDSIVDSLSPCIYPVSFTMVRRHSRVYVGNGGNSFIPVIRTDPPGVEEAPNAEVRTANPMPTVVRGVLVLNELGTRSELSDNSVMSRAALMDVSGRKVMDLVPGANDVRALAPGVYFVREEPQATSLQPQAVRKVVVTR